MIPATCKRLIEVDFPIAEVGRHGAIEKAGPKGHPSMLHLWWARRPLAACRSVLMGLLLPDPCDPHCPPEFYSKAWGILARRFPTSGRTKEALRESLLAFIGEFANWDLAANSTYLGVARDLIRAAHPDETPVVVDPFSGGGSIPLEALRLGCEALASDLNPVACINLKALLEDIPRHGNADYTLKDDHGENVVVHTLADAIRHVGQQIGAQAKKDLAGFYPVDPTGARPIAYLWARTVRCEAVGCGAEIPLTRSLWLSKKSGHRRALRYSVVRPRGKLPHINFEVYSPKTDKELQGGTVSRANATCPCCQTVLPAERVRAQLSARHGGAEVLFDSRGRRIGGAVLLAVVTIRNDVPGREFRVAHECDYSAVYEAQISATKLPPGSIPDEATPRGGGKGASRAFSVQNYGMMKWGDLFTSRQAIVNLHLCKAIQSDTIPGQLRVPLALALSRVVMSNVSMTRWNAHAQKMQHTFGRQALPIVWDFVEVVPTASAPGNWASGYDLVADIAQVWPGSPIATVNQASATKVPLSDGSSNVWFTDPPYYDAVPYSDLSDFFFVWLKRTLPNHPLLRDPSDKTNPLTPKTAEIVQDDTKKIEGGIKDRDFFEREMGRAFAEGRRVMRDDGIACVVFAHKTTEGWESLLTGMLRGGWTITASWPISTEMATRLRARDSAALATSVHLVCRPRPSDAGSGDWGEVKAAMEKRIREWLPTLQKHGVRGADAIFSCLGPALESYSRYDRVLTAADHEVPLGGDPDASEPHQRGFLAYVFEALSKEALREILGTADTDGFEEDARMTALFLWTLQSTKTTAKTETADGADDADEEGEDEGDKPAKKKAGFSMPFDTFIRITRPMGIHYPTMEGNLIDIEKGVVRLLPTRERSELLLGEVAARPGVEITLEDVKQMEFGFAKKRAELTLPAGKKGGRKGATPAQQQAEGTFTTLDRLHRAMLLFTLGRSTLLRQVLETEMREGKRFERLALALNALYPDGSDERRMLEGVQSAMRGVK